MKRMSLINCPVYNKEHLEVTSQLGGLLELIMEPITLIFTDVMFVHAHIDFVDHAVLVFARKINGRLGTAEADHVLLQYCLNLEFMHILYVCSFCREFGIQSDTLVNWSQHRT